jgi:tripartite-type tricarboxylate transporter receptor subunit TctC
MTTTETAPHAASPTMSARHSDRSRLVLARRVARGLACLAVALPCSVAAQATYPARPVTVFVGFAPGGSVDLLARAIAEELSGQLGQRFVVVNRDGGSSTIAMSAVLAAPADGYTLAGGAATPFTHVLHVLKDKPFSVESFEYVCQTFRNEFTVSVRNESPIRTFAELLDAIRARPGQLSYGHSGNATAPHLAAVELLQKTRLDAIDVPYKGESAAVPMLLGGQNDFAILSVTAAAAQKERVRPLAVFAERRVPALPDVPTVGELGIQLGTHAGLNGLFAPKGTPREALRALEGACERAVRSERFAQLAGRYAAVPAYLSSADFTRLVTDDHRRKGELIRSLPVR